MIIRRRMPRIINNRKRIGMIGMRSFRHSTMHIRRMLISRLPEIAPEDWQDAMAQPLGGQFPELEAPDEAPMLSTGTEPYRRRFGGAAQRPAAQRQSQTPQSRFDTPNRMPPDLQAIFDQHKRLGRVQSNPEVKQQAEIYQKTGGLLKSETELKKSPQSPPRNSERRSRPSQPQSSKAQPVQRETISDDNFPVVVDIPPPRRVRSRVEYVNRPEPKPKSQTAEDDGDEETFLETSSSGTGDELVEPLSSPQTDSISEMQEADEAVLPGTTPPAGSTAGIQPRRDDSYPFEVDDHSTDISWQESEKDDFATIVDTADDTALDQPVRESHAVDIPIRREPDEDSVPTTPNSPSLSDIHPDDDPYEVYLATVVDQDHGIDIDSDVPRETAPATSVQRHEDHETPVDDAQPLRDETVDFDEGDFYESAEEVQPDDVAPSDELVDSDVVTEEVDPDVDAAIARAEQPLPSDMSDDSSTPRSPSQAKPPKPGVIKPVQRMSVSRREPPTRIQREPLFESEVGGWDEPQSEDAERFDFGVIQERFARDHVEPLAAAPSLSMSRDESRDYFEEEQLDTDFEPDDFFEIDEPPSLPTQDMDLGTALFGPGAGGDESVSGVDIIGEEPSGPKPVMMPPIGRARHAAQAFTMPSSQSDQRVQRTPDKPSIPRRQTPSQRPVSADPGAPPVRDVRHAADVGQSSPDEADLLRLLDMPADTPIQRDASTALEVQRSPETTAPPSTVQRVDISDVESDVDEAPADDEQEQESQSNESAVKEMAEKVYSLIKRRLKNEQERYQSKK